MTLVIKISAAALVYICCAMLIRQYRPEFVFLLRFGAVGIILFLILGEASNFIDSVKEIFTVFNISSVHLTLLLKVSFVALISDFVTETLKDSGDTSLASVVTVATRVVIISFSLPVLKSLLVICSDLIK